MLNKRQRAELQKQQDMKQKPFKRNRFNEPPRDPDSSSVILAVLFFVYIAIVLAYAFNLTTQN